MNRPPGGRRLLSICLCLVVLAACLVSTEGAAAASVAVSPRAIGGGIASVNACDSNGFAFMPALDATGHVTTVTVGSIAGACAGGTLRVTLVNGTSSVGSGSASLPSSGFTGSAVVSMSPTPVSNQVTAVYAVIEGP
jgi:hypothetical protein